MINKIKQLKKTSIIISLVFIQSCALNLNTYDFETDSLESDALAFLRLPCSASPLSRGAPQKARANPTAALCASHFRFASFWAIHGPRSDESNAMSNAGYGYFTTQDGTPRWSARFPGADGSLPIRHGVGGFTTRAEISPV